jgi:hypothetical protein
LEIRHHYFGCNEKKLGTKLKVNGKIQYAFRRPRFPIICAIGAELISAESAAGFQRQIERFEFDVGQVLDIVDATGEGWAFHTDLTIVSPLTLKKRWTKAAVIRLFNESQNARRIDGVYPETALSNKTLIRIIAEVAALAAHGSPHRPLHTNTRRRVF